MVRAAKARKGSDSLRKVHVLWTLSRFLGIWWFKKTAIKKKNQCEGRRSWGREDPIPQGVDMGRARHHDVF